MKYLEKMTAGTPSWSICATVLEPTALVVSFASYYLSIGAKEVFIFLDAPQPQTQALLEGMPGVRVQLCDADYWKNVRGTKRSTNLVKRQIQNVYQAYRTSEADWLLHADVDEYIISDLPVERILKATPETVDFIRVPNLERVHVKGKARKTIFDGAFRKPVPAKVSTLGGGLVNPDHPLAAIAPRGVSGHVSGKSFVRTGRNIVPGVHAARSPGKVKEKLVEWGAQNIQLLHFDGITKVHWCAKYLMIMAHRTGFDKKILGADRVAQLNYLRRQEDPRLALSDMHDDLKTSPREHLARLSDLGLCKEIDMTKRISEALSQYGLLDAVDLSPEAFDREIASRYTKVASDIEMLLERDGVSVPKTRRLRTPVKKTARVKAVA